MQYIHIKKMANNDELFAGFMQDYIEIQRLSNEPPWCMSIEMLTQAYQTYVIKVKKASRYGITEYNVYKLLKKYIADHPSNINILGVVTHLVSPKLTVTGIRLRKVPAGLLAELN